MDRSVIFRCDASPEIGGGHVMRCLSLAVEMRRRGWACRFATLPSTLQTVPLLKAEGFEFFSPEMLGDDTDLLIVDHYALNREFESEARSWARHIVVIDDLADRPHDCDLLMDQTYRRDPADYKNLVPASCRILTGTNYALLRPQFAQERPAALKRRQETRGRISRILVMLGAGDKDNVTNLVLDGLEKLKNHYIIDVVLGAGALHIGIIQDKARSSHHKINVLTGVTGVAPLMAQADLAIGAGGTGSWERCCMGLPTLVVEIADNQQKIIAELTHAGAITSAGRYQDIDAAVITDHAQALISDLSTCSAMGNVAAELCDGNGVKNLADEIERIKQGRKP